MNRKSTKLTYTVNKHPLLSFFFQFKSTNLAGSVVSLKATDSEGIGGAPYLTGSGRMGNRGCFRLVRTYGISLGSVTPFVIMLAHSNIQAI